MDRHIENVHVHAFMTCHSFTEKAWVYCIPMFLVSFAEQLGLVQKREAMIKSTSFHTMATIGNLYLWCNQCGEKSTMGNLYLWRKRREAKPAATVVNATTSKTKPNQWSINNGPWSIGSWSINNGCRNESRFQKSFLWLPPNVLQSTRFNKYQDLCSVCWSGKHL